MEFLKENYLKIILLSACMVLLINFASCGRNYDNADKSIKSVYGDYFVQIMEWEDYDLSASLSIVYAKDTKV